MVRARATRWVADDFPGCVEIVITDSDGLHHRFEEKAPVVDADDRLHAQARFPVDVLIACRPQTQHSCGSEVVNVVDLAPWGVGDVGATYSVTRESLSWRPPAVYSDLSARARQAAALVTFRRWREAVGLDSAELGALEEHLWAWMTVGPETFNDWYESDPLVRLGEGEPLPDAVRGAVAACGIDQGGVQDAVHALVQITYGGLFGGCVSEWSLVELETVDRLTARHGVPLVSAERFVDSLWVDDEWGRPGDATVARWRESG